VFLSACRGSLVIAFSRPLIRDRRLHKASTIAFVKAEAYLYEIPVGACLGYLEDPANFLPDPPDIEPQFTRLALSRDY
jgi:hypothetical protein